MKKQLMWLESKIAKLVTENYDNQDSIYDFLEGDWHSKPESFFVEIDMEQFEEENPEGIYDGATVSLDCEMTVMYVGITKNDERDERPEDYNIRVSVDVIDVEKQLIELESDFEF